VEKCSRIPLQLLCDLISFIEFERASSYTETELNTLWDRSGLIRRELENLGPAYDIPFVVWQLIGNIDFGAIKREYRAWILDDAERVLNLLLSGQPESLRDT
jgi:hypothetical protein